MPDTKNISEVIDDGMSLKEYSDAQFTVIVDLQKKLQQLQEENKSLKIMLEQNLPPIGNTTHDLTLGISKEQLICEVQIEFLKNQAVARELTLEETKKFATFQEILDKIRKDPMNRDTSVEKLPDSAFLSVIANGS